MVRTKQTAKESTGGKAPPLPRHLRNRDVLLRKGQYFTAAALKRTRRQFLLGRLHRFMAPFLRARFITGSRRRWIYKRGKLVRCRRMPKGLSKCICTMACGWLDESALQSLALCGVASFYCENTRRRSWHLALPPDSPRQSSALGECDVLIRPRSTRCPGTGRKPGKAQAANPHLHYGT